MRQFPRSCVVLLVILALARAHSAFAQVVISEFMATNANTNILDEDGSHSDWLELKNTGATSVTLNGWYLTDDGGDLRKWQFPLTSPAVVLAPGANLRIWCSGKDRKASSTRLHTNFKLDGAGEYLGLVHPDGFAVEHSYAPVYPPQATDVAYGISGAKAWNVLSGPTLNSQWRVRVPQDSAEFTTTMAGWNTNPTFADTGWTLKMVTVIAGISKGLGYDAGGTSGARAFLINYSGSPNGILTNPSDVGASTYGMYNTTFPSGSPVLCARTTFNVADKTTIQQLRLNVKYDDGFVVYLNGTAILTQNAPATPLFNSTSLSDREDDQCEEFETFNLAGAQAFLVNGTNLLAIQGFKTSRNSPQFVLNPSLEAYQTVAGATGGTPGYLTTPSPGGDNTTASIVIGPDIAQTTRNPARPAPSTNTPFTIATRVRPTLNPVSSVSLRYLRMFSAENNLAMFDDGPAGGHGDAVAGDSVFTALIPGNFMATLAESQMLRWRIVATDSAGNASTDPPYRDPFDNDQYFGTVALTPTIQTQLPLVLWFHNSSSTSPVFATTEAGFRSAFFFKLPTESIGRFYDNVRLTLHGQSTAGFGKKSQNVNFNTDNKFKWREGEEEIGGMNLLSNWADKSHVRNSMTWELWNRTRHPSHWCQTVRVQQITATATAGQGNSHLGVDSQFLCLSDMVEDGNDDFLERWGLDPNGALYKCYNNLTDTTQSSSTNNGGIEKKTREFEDFSDVATLVASMSTGRTVTQRRQWFYDNVDVAGLINFVAVHNLVHSHDFGHKNYYVYRDTLGSGEWTPIPWDQDLSFGHRWTSAQNYFDDDLESASTIFSGGGGNYLINIITTSGSTEIAQMYLRRLRSLMDQYYGPTSTPINHFANRIDSYLNTMDPPSWPVTTDAERDFMKWGFWVDGSSSVIAYTDPRAVDHRIRPSALRIKSTNNTVLTGGPYPGANPYASYGGTTNLHTSAEPFIPGRRKFLYNENGLNPTILGQPIPAAQPATPALVIENINFNPGGTSQDGEYFVIRNTSSSAVDISIWRLSGAIDYDFKAGTVIPAAGTSTSDGSSSSYVNQLIVARNAKGFRARVTSPKAAEYRQVQGGYKGQLSARGGTITLSKPIDPVNFSTTSYTQIVTNTYTGAPTVAQTNLRITELSYHPADPTPAEVTALPGVDSDDFEFIELINNGLSPLSLAEAKFETGIEFTFPTPYSLAAGARCLLIANTTAFHLRYGNGYDDMIAGEYFGSLNNSGEQIRLLDSVGEVVLDFSYRDDWYPPTDGSGRSLVVRNDTTAYNLYGSPTAWAIGTTPGGTPGIGDTSTSNVYEGWRWDYFTGAEVTAGLITAAASDADFDGSSNLHVYAFGGNPRNAGGYSRPESKIVNVDGIDYPAVEFTRRKNALDLTYSVEVKGDLDTVGGWVAINLPVGSPVDLGNGLERVVYRDANPAGSPRFFQVRTIK